MNVYKIEQIKKTFSATSARYKNRLYGEVNNDKLQASFFTYIPVASFKRCSKKKKTNIKLIVLYTIYINPVNIHKSNYFELEF